MKKNELIELMIEDDEEIEEALNSCYGWGVVEIVSTPQGVEERELKERRAIAQARLNKVLNYPIARPCRECGGKGYKTTLSNLPPANCPTCTNGVETKTIQNLIEEYEG